MEVKMKKSILIAFSLLALSACTTSSDFRESDEYVEQRDQQMQIVSQAAATSPVEEIEEETIEIEEQPVESEEVATVSKNQNVETVDPVLVGDVSPIVDSNYQQQVLTDDGYGVTEEIQFGGEDLGTSSYQYGLEGTVVPEQIQPATLEEQTQQSPIVNQDDFYVESVRVDTSGFANGFYYLSKDCNVRLTPSAEGTVVNVVRSGRRLWIEGYNSSWAKVFRQSGVGYIYKSCLFQDNP